MPNFTPACRGCSGEDCACCEVYHEMLADQRAQYDRDPNEDMDDQYEPDEPGYCPSCGSEDCDGTCENNTDDEPAVREDFGYFGEMGCNED